MAVSAGINITYKLLFNDAVAMTGGQPVDGQLHVDQITHQAYHEGVKRIAVVSDEPEKYRSGYQFAPGTMFTHRKALDTVQRELRGIEGVTLLIYDQTCASEKRRRRKRGQYPDPAKRFVINDRVCEGCGDCGVASNCTSIQPLKRHLVASALSISPAATKIIRVLRAFAPVLWRSKADR